MHSLVTFWFGLLEKFGYVAVVALMAMESSIFPVPSEVVIPPAAYWATQGRMSFWGVVLAGTLGSYLGSTITYWISRWLGRLAIVKFGRYFFISEAKLERAEIFVHRYAAGGIFFARLLPVVRHLISIPAGIVRMNFAVFSAMTIIGSFIWCWILAWFGTHAITQDMMSDPSKMVAAVKAQSHWFIGFVALFCVLYFVAMKVTSRGAASAVPKA